MEFTEFYQNIQKVIENHNKINKESTTLKASQRLLKELDCLATNHEIDKSLKMTQASILFEGFYRHLDNSPIKKLACSIRTKRWLNHFGTPTLTFLLSYAEQIEQTTKLFNESLESDSIEQLPWFINSRNDLAIDTENNVITDPASISRVEPCHTAEITGIFTKTRNPFGGFTTTPCDLVSQQFLSHAAKSAQSGGKVLEIGAAFGAATLAAIAKGATVFCNDIEPENLAVIRQRFLATMDEPEQSITGDDSKLILVPGELPDELTGLPEKHFDAILICRVLHFFSGAKIEESLALMSRLLAPGGKIYIVCETPFLKNWQRFIPEYHRRVEQGLEWPGEITEPAEFESSGRASSLPKFVHWITKEVLERSLMNAGFSVEHAAYINRNGQFPEDLLLPEHGKESVGAIGIV